MSLRVLFCLLFICLTADGQTTGVSERRALTSAAASFVGIRETGYNRGQPHVLFMKPYGYGPGTQWCALFVHHCFVVAGVQHGVKGIALAANWAVPVGAVVWKWGRPIAGRHVFSGDIALFRFDTRGRSPGGSRYNHVEIIVNWPDDEDYCWVIGGNTSNPEKKGQEGVFAKRRLKREILVVSRIGLMYV